MFTRLYKKLFYFTGLLTPFIKLILLSICPIPFLEPDCRIFLPLFRLLRWRIFAHISILDSKTKPSLVGMNIWRCTQVVEGSALEILPDFGNLSFQEWL